MNEGFFIFILHYIYVIQLFDIEENLVLVFWLLLKMFTDALIFAYLKRLLISRNITNFNNIIFTGDKIQFVKFWLFKTLRKMMNFKS